MNDLILQLINEPESNSLDFKEEQYKFIQASDEEKSELLKDILAFANSFRRTDAYILIGIKEIKGSKAEITGIKEDIDDSALQQFVYSKINRRLEFSYSQTNFETQKIGIIHVPIQEKPFYLKKDYGKLKKNIVYFRNGSSTEIANPDTIANMKIITSKDKISLPKLELQFENQAQEIILKYEILEKMTESEVKEQFNKFKEKYKQKIIPTVERKIQETNPIENGLGLSINLKPRSFSDIALAAIAGVPNYSFNSFDNLNTEENFNKYNNYLNEEYEKYLSYLKLLQLYKNQGIGVFTIQIYIKNTGNIPANEIDINLHFPDGFELYEYIESISEPTEPELPDGFREYITLSKFTILHSPFDINKLKISDIFLNSNKRYEKPNVSMTSLKKSNSYDVNYEIIKVKHHKTLFVDKLYMKYKDYSKIKSFEIDYKINADNISELIEGKLKVNFLKTEE